MTTTTRTPSASANTVATRRQAFIAAERAAATAAGTPRPRQTYRHVIPNDAKKFGGTYTHIVVQFGDDLYAWDLTAGAHEAPDLIDDLTLRKLILDAYDLASDDPTSSIDTHSVFFADRRALGTATRRCEQMAKRTVAGGSRGDLGASGALGFRSTLPKSVYTPVLTELLADLWWLPDCFDPWSATDWMAAFGIVGSTDYLAWTTLLTRCMEGKDLEGTHLRDYADSMCCAELFGVRSSRSKALTSQCVAFDRSGSFSTSAAALQNVDPGLVDLNVVGGTVSSFAALKTLSRDGLTWGRVGSNFKVKAGSHLNVWIGDGAPTRVTVLDLDVDAADDLLVGLTPSAHLERMVSDATSLAAPLMVTEAPFLGFPAKAPKSWVSRSATPRPVRTLDMPVDVAIAGMPGATA